MVLRLISDIRPRCPTPPADTQELVALKYHPDRNPGKETEVNAKFQTIQHAHEILSSPEQKLKYDAQCSRKPTNRFPTGSGVHGNPWQDVTSQYPTPPQRPSQAPTSAARGYASSSAPRTSGSASASASAGSSAHRYSSFNPPPKPTAKTSRDNPDTRYQAWKSMRPDPKTSKPGQSASAAYASGADSRTYGGAGRPPPPTSASTASAASSSSMPPPPPRTPLQKQKAEASFGSRRNPGFFPRSPMGDEPPAAASTSNYFTSRSRSSNFEDRAGAARPDGGQSGRTTPTGTGTGTGTQRTYGARRPTDTTEEPCFDARQSTPYQTHGGEKFNLFDGVSFPDMSRTKSQRAPTAQERPSSRRRSSSLPDESDNMGKATAKNTAANDANANANANGAGPSSGAGSRTGTRSRTGPGLRHKFSTSSTPMPQFDMHYRMRKEEDGPPTTPTAKSTQGNQRGTPGAFFLCGCLHGRRIIGSLFGC